MENVSLNFTGSQNNKKTINKTLAATSIVAGGTLGYIAGDLTTRAVSKAADKMLDPKFWTDRFTKEGTLGTVGHKAADIANLVKKTKRIKGMIPDKAIKFGAAGIGALIPLTVVICKAIANKFSNN